MIPLGVSLRAGGADVAVVSAHATAIEFCLFEGEREVRRVRLRERLGDVWHDFVPGVAVGARYGLRAQGVFAPDQGHRFDASKLLIDPYATALDRVPVLHPSMLEFGEDSGVFVPKAVVGAGVDVPTRRGAAWDRSVLYELHVRGFTMRHAGVPAPLRGRFAGLGHPAAIDHLVKLGVTAVEVMPAAAWIEERHLAAAGLANYWGYNPIALMAPDPRLALEGWAEIAATVAALAEAGIETILDVVLNHSGEGDALGPTLSFRGLDNALYYRLNPEDLARYVDDTGCGNALAFDRPVLVRLAMDALRCWAGRTGVAGFRFDLASTMGRRADGFDPAAPLLSAIAQDPVLREMKLIAEPWDPGVGGYQGGAFPAAWGEWNDLFRDDVRQFWRGDDFQLGRLATRLAGSADRFGGRAPSRSVNYVVAHDGFSLADLVSFTAKHNEANGEGNRDGTQANHSWNHGVEGASDDPGVIAARLADQRALLACLLLARGTPMLAMGSEFGQSQGGNNNAYAQDNAVSWLDWTDAGLVDWVARLTGLRARLGVLREDRFLSGAGVPADVAWLDAAGEAMTGAGWTAPEAGTVQMLLGGRVDLIVHRGAAAVEVRLPSGRWVVLADSAAPERGGVVSGVLLVAARSVVLLEARGGRVDDAVLARLAAAAGIAAEWWTVDGVRTEVSPETQRALLRAMGKDPGAGRDALAEMASGQYRPLPLAVVGDELEVRLAPGVGWRRLALVVRLESGEVLRRVVDDAVGVAGETVDGLACGVWRFCLPEVPEGRHVVWREDAPEFPCHVTVAPARCHLPEAFRRGERRWGVAAQLYALRREGDGGIGDFTTLARLVRAAGEAGAAVVGVNPLHMLFPGDRERASPYHPSDRRFLDPIYIDTGEVVGSGELIDYPGVWARKLKVLRARFARERDRAGFAEFVGVGGERLRTFARFEAGDDPEEIRFQQWLQFVADGQLAEASLGLEIGLFRDLAVGAAPDGAEAWACREQLAKGAWVGSPPDPFSPTGQNWHLPPPLPEGYWRDGFEGFGALLAANMRHAGALRIDHVMGLARLFWIPDGASGAEGAYVHYPLRELIGQVCLESQRAGCMVVGEDLGTVPDGLRPALEAADILSYRVLLLEREGKAFRAEYPRRSVACVTTHDLAPIAGWWAGTDQDERAALGMAVEDREPDRAALLEVIGEGEASVAAHRFVAGTASELMLVQADDLAGATMGVNLPGTDRQRPNWRLRVETPVEQLFDRGAAIVAAVRAQRAR